MLDNFFIYGEIPANAEYGIYEYSLVVLSYLMASFGSYAGLTLAVELYHTTEKAMKNWLHIGGAVALGAGIWSMHFIGMLAYNMEMKVSYDLPLTLLSVIVAIFVSSGALWTVRIKNFKIIPMISSSLLLGAAISLMHYSGMAAMRMDADLFYIPSIFALSIVIAIVASFAALMILKHLVKQGGTGATKELKLLLAALIMGFAICGMHYTGMSASVFIPWANCRYDPNQNFALLALIMTFTSSALFLLPLALIKFKRDKESVDNQLIETNMQLPVLSIALFITLIAVLWISRP